MKNKRIADISIVVLILLFIVITLIKVKFRNNGYFEMLSFIIEASLVGSIADWFAITALFEEPFLVGKLPIIASHTAIISKNRDSIVSAVASMVQNELLSKKVLKVKIKDVNIIDSLIDFVDENVKTRSELYEALIGYFVKKLNNIDTMEIARVLETNLKQRIEGVDISIYLNKAISLGIQNNEFKKIFNIVVDSIIEYINRDATKYILEKFANDLLKKEANSLVMEKIIGILKSVNAINTSDVIMSTLEQSNKILLNLKNEKDLLRCRIIGKIEQVFEKVQTDNELKISIEKWKIETLEEISIQNELNKIIKDIIRIITEKEDFLLNTSLNKYNEVERDLISEEDIRPIVTWIKTQIEKQWDGLKNNHVNKRNIDQFIKESLFKLMESKYESVGYLVKQVLNNMDDESLNNFIKQKSGNDLHGIRLNGSIIGALFGGIVFIATHLIYDLILPNILNFKF